MQINSTDTSKETEDHILSGLDEQFEDNNVGNNEDEVNGQDAGSEGDGQSDTNVEGRGAQDTQSKQGTDPQPRTGDTDNLVKGPRTDANGNVVDGQGNVIAAGGRERALFYQTERLRSNLTDTQRELTRVNNELKQQNVLTQQVREYGLSTNDLANSLELIRLGKTNPVQAAQNVIAMVLQQGGTLEDILGDAVNGFQGVKTIDNRAIRGIVDEAVGPLRARQQAEARQAEIADNARRDVDKFLDTHLYADVHLDTITNFIAEKAQSGEHLTPEQAYVKVQQYAVKNGFDFSQPLAAQAASRLKNSANPNQQQRRQQPMPNGRSANSPRNEPVQQEAYADTDDSYASIIKAAMSSATARN